MKAWSCWLERERADRWDEMWWQWVVGQRRRLRAIRRSSSLGIVRSDMVRSPAVIVFVSEWCMLLVKSPRECCYPSFLPRIFPRGGAVAQRD